MGALIYSSICSLDGYVADRDGNFDWAAPDEEVHGFVNDRERPIGTYLFGRRMYEVMAVWESAVGNTAPGTADDFAELWRSADKIVYSTTLQAVSTSRTRLEREFDPAAIRALKASSPRDLSVGGPGLAACAIRAGLVDDVQLYLVPSVVGGGTPVLPQDVRLDLELVDEHRFRGGTVFLHYRTR
ncbi:dihydrofolate reductase family protein [Rhodococcus maanshanensis]|uniref:Dihydrofolate reductase n=1 Tax=Rhodococcus maanshanensis TaxID=183556 RepID=A0A1H7F934_9NOCA|nr:dihydrofolate reductase family protein [Rhodococcus maanshanensis]SEK22589.1 Dihydrofolate reductase [Rhodococcus maanshanensis]